MNVLVIWNILQNLQQNLQFWERPDVGLAPPGVWRVPPPSPIVIGGPFPQAKPLPSPPSPSLSAPPLLALFARLWEGAAQAGGGGGVLGRKGVGGGLQAALGARPTSGSTRQFALRNLKTRRFFCD